MLGRFLLNIRRRESPFYDRLYRIAKSMRGFELPVVPGVHSLLYGERQFRLSFCQTIFRIFYWTPLFKSRCQRVGKRLQLVGGVPLIMGNLRLIIGDDVTMFGQSTLSGAKVFDAPTLTVGNHTHLGHQLIINVGCDVTIGKRVLSADRVTIMSYDGHPTDPGQRHLPAPPASSRKIVIGDNVWIGINSVILKGVTIGEGSVIAAGSVVTTRVPPNSLAMGNPARIYPLMMTCEPS